MLDLVRAGPCPGRPRGDRRRSRRRCHLPARLPGGPRGAQTGGSGWSTSSSPTVRTPTEPTGAWRPPWPASAPTSTRCATGSRRFGLLDDRVRFVQGPPGTTLARVATSISWRCVRLGDGLGAALGPTLEAIHPRLAPGAVVIVSGTADAGVEAAVASARARLGIDAPLERIDWNSVMWTMPQGSPVSEPPAERPTLVPHRPALLLAPPASDGTGRADRGRRLLQHAPGGPPHAPVAQPLVPARHRGPRLRGHRGRQRVGPRAPAERRRGRAPSVPSSTSSTSVMAPTRRPPWP